MTETQAQHRARHKAYYAGLSPERKAIVRTRAYEWNKEHPKSRRNIQLKAKYGLTEEAWNALFVAQGSMCGCCGAREPGYKYGWHVDHCHVSKKVRGILCHGCNTALGHADDSVARLKLLVAYLESYK